MRLPSYENILTETIVKFAPWSFVDFRLMECRKKSLKLKQVNMNKELYEIFLRS